jgi:hypothetical protein
MRSAWQKRECSLAKLIAITVKYQKNKQPGQRGKGDQRNLKFQINYRNLFPDNHRFDIYSTHRELSIGSYSLVHKVSRHQKSCGSNPDAADTGRKTAATQVCGLVLLWRRLKRFCVAAGNCRKDSQVPTVSQAALRGRQSRRLGCHFAATRV